jgi:hypothetical protein
MIKNKYRMQAYLLFKQLVHTVTTPLQRVKWIFENLLTTVMPSVGDEFLLHVGWGRHTYY